jgi:TrmH family RNA methyltransferase
MITSRSNAWFKRLHEAVREHRDEIVIEGPKAISDAIAAGWKPIAVVGVGAGPPAGTDILFSPQLFKSISDTKASQGVIALFQRPGATVDQLLARRDTIVVALDGVQDPGNVGTIVRLAAAFDAAGIALLPGSADPYGPKAIRASAGAILTVPVVEMSVDELLATGLELFAADGSGKPLDPPARAAILAFGSEGSGVSPPLLTRATRLAIPTSGRVESLNVAAAAAILLWRSFRSRRFP